MTRTIWYVSGTRADYGLMRRTLRAISQRDDLELGILVTGMHLDPAYGNTVQEIEADGFPIVARIALPEHDATGAGMARGIGRMVTGFTDAIEAGQPDILLLLGDRGEMLAGAIAAIHLNVPIVHIHGGERSGTVDEPVRHAVSKLSHFHFTATQDAADRLCRMGEQPDNIFVTGAPGLVGLTEARTRSREALAGETGFDPARPIALLVYHPVLQEAADAGSIATSILTALSARGYQTVALKPNSDAGSHQIRTVLEAHEGVPGFWVATHLDRETFINWMAAADVMIGNSSAGIIEAASFGTPVINVGLRQNVRERNANVTDVASNAEEIGRALDSIDTVPSRETYNIYGDGASDTRIAQMLATINLDGAIWKFNAY